MKFGKRLKKQVEESLPEWRDKFLAYKRLKRLVRLVSATASSSSPRRRGSAAEAAFLRLLDAEVDRFNAFFLEREEDFVIRHRELKETAEDARRRPLSAAETRSVRKEIVDLHGEMVLLLNYSAINYTGLAKILKKHDKRTGRLLRLPFIEKVLGQPFFATELISRLVRECEATMEAVFEASRGHAGAPAGTAPVAAVAAAGQGIFRNTVAALVTMGELRELHVRPLLAATDGPAGVRPPAVRVRPGRRRSSVHLNISEILSCTLRRPVTGARLSYDMRNAGAYRIVAQRADM